MLLLLRLGGGVLALRGRGVAEAVAMAAVVPGAAFAAERV